MQNTESRLKGELGKIYTIAENFSLCLGLSIKTKQEIGVILQNAEKHDVISLGEMFDIINNGDGQIGLILKNGTNDDLERRFLIIKDILLGKEKSGTVLNICLSNFIENESFFKYMVQILSTYCEKINLLTIIDFSSNVPKLNLKNVQILIEKLSKEGRIDISIIHDTLAEIENKIKDLEKLGSENAQKNIIFLEGNKIFLKSLLPSKK